VYKRASHNPNARVSPNYSIVEDLSQTPCTMSALEVIQSCPAQRATMLYVIRATDSSNQLFMKFDTTEVKAYLHYHVAF
jgi:hypothetical protein